MEKLVWGRPRTLTKFADSKTQSHSDYTILLLNFKTHFFALLLERGISTGSRPKNSLWSILITANLFSCSVGGGAPGDTSVESPNPLEMLLSRMLLSKLSHLSSHPSYICTSHTLIDTPWLKAFCRQQRSEKQVFRFNLILTDFHRILRQPFKSNLVSGS